MIEVLIFVAKVIGGAIGGVLFYQLGLKILGGCFNFRLKNEPHRWVKRLISEMTQFLIPVVIFSLLVILAKFFNK